MDSRGAQPHSNHSYNSTKSNIKYCICLVAIIYNREGKNVSFKFLVAVVNIHRMDAMLILHGQGFQKRDITGIPSACMAIFLSGYLEKWAHHTLTAFTFPVPEAGRSHTGYALDTKCACLLM
jgi:hypothetical protein